MASEEEIERLRLAANRKVGLGQRRRAAAHRFIWSLEFRTEGHRREDLPRLSQLIRSEQLRALQRFCGQRGISCEGIEKLLDEEEATGNGR